MYYHFATTSILAPMSAALLLRQLCLHFVCRAVIILPDGEVNKRLDAALETRECFDNIICEAPAGTRPVKIAMIDLTAVTPALLCDFRTAIFFRGPRWANKEPRSANAILPRVVTQLTTK